MLVAGLAVPSWGQDAAPVIAGFRTQGTITAGYRFTDVQGRRQKFDELFNLRNGFRIHEFSWMGRSVTGDSFADSISLFSSGLGGDPYSNSTLRIVKNGVWEVSTSYRQAYYYWDRNDAAIQPSGQSGLTSNHDFANVRRFGSASASVYVTPDFKLNFEYNRTQRTGNRFSTRTLEYFDPLSSWGSYARANPYWVEAPADEVSNRFAAGFSWNRDDWSFFYRAGYQTYHERLEVSNVVSPQRSINVDSPATANELVNLARWSETRRVSAPFSEFSYNGAVRSGLRIRGGYIYYLHSGPSRVDARFDGTARANSAGTAFAPFNVTMIVDGELREPSHVIDQGFSLDIADWMVFHSDYRYSRFTLERDARFASTDADGPATAVEEVRWEEGLHTLDTSLEIVPFDNLLVRPGVRLVKRDVTLTEEGIADPQASRPSKIVSPILSVYYSPTSKLTLRGDVRSTTNGGPYTRITPRTDFGGRWVVRYAPTQRFSIENAFRFMNADYTTTDFENRVRLNSTTLRFEVNDDLAFTGGFTYDSYLATAQIDFIRGTDPRNVTWRDQTISRVWQAGVDVIPRPWMRLRLNGNYVRTNGVGEISGELPTFGPLTWPMVTGTVELDVPRAGTLALDLQRTYYIEEIVTGDNFSANILGIRWIVDF